jgi:pantoate--beta-alanine ligase
METVTTIAAVRERVAAWRTEGLTVALAPTMGNLHRGHVSLIEAARAQAKRCVTSIFVNPTQFGPTEDLASYPRTPDRDAQMLAAAGCNLLFMPDVAEMYPGGAERATRVEVPGLSSILCGEFRPGHFAGVTTVVTRLFNIVQPDIAVFGEKDFQQLTIIRRMVADLSMPIEIIGVPTVRDADGLALSSRNQYLTAAERARAPRLHEALVAAAARVTAGSSDFAQIERAGLEALGAAGFVPDYFSIRDARELSPPGSSSRQLVILSAARLGKARLIDNVRLAR